VATGLAWPSPNPCMADFQGEWVSDAWIYKNDRRQFDLANQR